MLAKRWSTCSPCWMSVWVGRVSDMGTTYARGHGGTSGDFPEAQRDNAAVLKPAPPGRLGAMSAETTNEPGPDAEPDYHLFLDAGEPSVTAQALRLLISDQAHEVEIRRLAREVLERLGAEPDAEGRLTVSLSPQQMKITYSAVRLLLNDLQRGQAAERDVLWSIL